MDEIALKRAIQRADKTKKVIETYKDYWDELESDLWKLWKSTKSENQAKREEIFREHHAIQAVKAKLQKVVNEGIKAEDELKKVRDGH